MKPTMKKWLTGLLSAALLAGNLPVYALNTAYAAEEDGFFTDETDSFEGGSQESEDTQSEDSFASVSEFTGFTSGEAEEDFSGEEDFEASDSQEGFEGETDPIIMPETDAQDEGGYLQNLTLYTSQSGASTVGLKRMSGRRVWRQGLCGRIWFQHGFRILLDHSGSGRECTGGIRPSAGNHGTGRRKTECGNVKKRIHRWYPLQYSCLRFCSRRKWLQKSTLYYHRRNRRGQAGLPDPGRTPS